MADGQEVSGSARSDGTDAGRRLNPENGSGSVVVLLQEKADKALGDHLLEVVECLVSNVKEKHLPSLKLLFDIAERIGLGQELSEAAVKSFTDSLRDSLQTMKEEHELGTGVRVQRTGTGEQEQGTGI
jgi:hypothetical protein